MKMAQVDEGLSQPMLMACAGIGRDEPSRELPGLLISATGGFEVAGVALEVAEFGAPSDQFIMVCSHLEIGRNQLGRDRNGDLEGLPGGIKMPSDVAEHPEI